MWTVPLQGNDGLALYVIERMREWDRREIFALRYDDDDMAFLRAVIATGDVGWIAGQETEPIAVFGCAPMWPGVWSMWFFATDNLRQIGLSVTKLVKRVIVPALIRDGAHRLECRSMEGHIDAQDWLETIGARREATLKAFGRAGEDFHVYTWDCG